MKKLLLLMSMVAGVFVSTFAVPSGVYKDRNGNQVLVSDSQNLYKLDGNGYVKTRWKIKNEQSDGSFTLVLLNDREEEIPGTVPSTRNGWWQENGEIHLDLESSPRPYTRQ